MRDVMLFTGYALEKFFQIKSQDNEILHFIKMLKSDLINRMEFEESLNNKFADSFDFLIKI